MKLIYNNLRITAVVIAPFWIVSFIVLTLTNSKSCKQVIIDSSEVRMHIDIPKVDFCNCYYDMEKDARLAIYTLKVDVNDFIKKNQLKKIDRKDVRLSIPLPIKERPVSEQLYANTGITWGDTWQYFIEKESGRIWLEIVFKPTLLTNIVDWVASLIFLLPPLLVAMWFFKFSRMIYLNMRKLKPSSF